jgi:hypothetical protein
MVVLSKNAKGRSFYRQVSLGFENVESMLITAREPGPYVSDNTMGVNLRPLQHTTDGRFWQPNGDSLAATNELGLYLLDPDDKIAYVPHHERHIPAPMEF